MSDPFETYDLLCDSYIRYIQTILGFNNNKLEEERDKLLRETGCFFKLHVLNLSCLIPLRGKRSRSYATI